MNSKIKTIIDKSFGIRCPLSLMSSTDIFQSFDFESSCTWGTNRLNDTAFCGKCASKNTNILFTNINSTLDYRYVILKHKF